MMAAAGDGALARRLRAETRGAVLFDRFDRGRYATDASIYQVMPLGVVVPRDWSDVAAALDIPVGTSKARLNRAKLKLRESLVPR